MRQHVPGTYAKILSQEVRLLQVLDHPNIIKLYRMIETEQDYFIIMYVLYTYMYMYMLDYFIIMCVLMELTWGTGTLLYVLGSCMYVLIELTGDRECLFVYKALHRSSMSRVPVKGDFL